jgi:hypothetical protein
MEMIMRFKELEKLCHAKGYTVTMEMDNHRGPVMHFAKIEVGYKGIYVTYKTEGEDAVAVARDAIEEAEKDILKWHPS